MKLIIEHGRVIDPASGRDERADVAVAAGRIVSIGRAPVDFKAERRIDASGCVVMPGLVDLAVRLREPGHEHEGMLLSELKAAAAGGVTSLVCPPDTDPPLDEPGLVEMLKFRARQLSSCRLFPLGALTRGLHGDALTEMAHLSEAGCVGFSQADHPVRDSNVLMRALQYAATFGHTVWLRPQDAWLSTGVAAMKMPDSPPMMKSATNDRANSIGVVSCRLPRKMVPSQLKTLIAEGSAIMMVATMKPVPRRGSMPLWNMWWPQTIKPRPAMPAIE